MWSERKGFPLLTAAAVLVVLAGCSTMSEAQREDRAMELEDHEQRFLTYKRRCVAKGGRIFIDSASNVGRRGIPRQTDRYYCI